jgi:ABC-type uncharacterized transport system substrate-binding protein
MLDTITKSAMDAVQTSKKIAIDTLVKHEDLNKTLHGFVDAQTEYTKKAYDATIEASQNLYKTFTNYSFYTDMVKTAQEQAKTIFNTGKKK